MQVDREMNKNIVLKELVSLEAKRFKKVKNSPLMFYDSNKSEYGSGIILTTV